MKNMKTKKRVSKTRRSTKEVQETKSIKDTINEIITKRLRFKALNEPQKEFSKLILDNQITVGYGPAGTGKSYVSIFKALELIQLKSNSYNKIIIIKPVVESEENLGFLPGNAKEKLEPYVASSLALVDKIIGKKKRVELEELGVIEIQALAFIRGLNIDNCVLVMEEAQNMSKGQMKTLLTRIGTDTKFIISGDLDQSDRYKDVKQSGLYDVKSKLIGIDDVGLFGFELKDIVRNPLISKILDRYKTTDVPKSFINTEKVLLTENKKEVKPKIEPAKKETKKVSKNEPGFFAKYFKW